MKLSQLKIDGVYQYVKDGFHQSVKYLGMETDKYNFVPIFKNGQHYGRPNGLTEGEVINRIRS